LCLCVSGCKSFLDPTEIGRYSGEDTRKAGKQPLMVQILTQLQPGTDDPEPEYAMASDVLAEDLVAVDDEYAIQRGDLLSVTVDDLQGQGAQAVMTRTVNERGQLRLQLLDQPVQAAGLTEAELEQAVKQAYIAANQLPDPQVSVVINEAQGRTYTVAGAVGAPSRYLIYRPDLRLLEALIQARSVQPGVETIYVIRQQPKRAAAAATNGPAGAADPLKPQPRPAQPAGASTRAASDGGDDSARLGTVAGQAVPVTRTAAAPAQPTAAATAPPAGGFRFNPPQEPGDLRIIRIPHDRLSRGEQKYNIVIRPNDMIVAPLPRTGVYYMGGHVSSVGAYTIVPENKVTLTRAIVSAGMLDAVAIPWRTDVIRKVGPDRQIWVSVDLDKIFSGDAPDLYLRPDDVVMVGTSWYAPFLVAARNGFRLVYGFGFLYDRNFADSSSDGAITF
jgi:protein involved in polysaccharide export with SLBB domain